MKRYETSEICHTKQENVNDADWYLLRCLFTHPFVRGNCRWQRVTVIHWNAFNTNTDTTPHIYKQYSEGDSVHQFFLWSLRSFYVIQLVQNATFDFYIFWSDVEQQRDTKLNKIKSVKCEMRRRFDSNFFFRPLLSLLWCVWCSICNLVTV